MHFPTKIKLLLPNQFAEMARAPVFRLQQVDSTNNYAMQLIDDDKAQAGTTVVALQQTAGRGQRGKSWICSPGDSLLMSVMLRPAYALGNQFLFLASLATTIARAVSGKIPGLPVHLKWPNDLIINDRKAGGILIENVLRGNSWLWAVVGFGLNLNQGSFLDETPNATSLRLETGLTFELEELMQQVRDAILSKPEKGNPEEIMMEYGELLYKIGEVQQFRSAGGESFSGKISGVLPDGRLVLETESGTRLLKHGEAEWMWP